MLEAGPGPPPLCSRFPRRGRGPPEPIHSRPGSPLALPAQDQSPALSWAAPGLLVPSARPRPSIVQPGKTEEGTTDKVTRPGLEQSGLRAAFLPPGPRGDRFTASARSAGAAGSSGEQARGSHPAQFSVLCDLRQTDSGLTPASRAGGNNLPPPDVGKTRGEGTHKCGRSRVRCAVGARSCELQQSNPSRGLRQPGERRQQARSRE